jgi:hypothetical protein
MIHVIVGRCQNNAGNGQFIAFRRTEDQGNVRWAIS